MLATVFMMKQGRADMSFGKRGVQIGSMPRPAFAAATPEAPEGNVGNEPELPGSLFRGKRSDDFDIDLSYMQPYGFGKSVIIMILLWVFLGGLGAHRFYLGHLVIGLALLTASIVGVVSFAVASTEVRNLLEGIESGAGIPPLWLWLMVAGVTIALWCLIDGIYVICRMLSAKVGG